MEARSIALERISFFHLFIRNTVFTTCNYCRQLTCTVQPRASLLMGSPFGTSDMACLLRATSPSSNEAQPSNVALKLMTFNLVTAVTRFTRLA
jgi:hypothetical protein